MAATENDAAADSPRAYAAASYPEAVATRSRKRVVGDGTRQAPRLLLWRFRDGQFEGPRVVLTHRGSFHVQILHVHPRFSPDGK